MTEERMIAVPLDLLEAAIRVLDYVRHPEKSGIADELRELVRQQEILHRMAEALEDDVLPHGSRIILIGGADERARVRGLLLESVDRYLVERPQITCVSSPSSPHAAPFWSSDWRNKRGRKR